MDARNQPAQQSPNNIPLDRQVAVIPSATAPTMTVLPNLVTPDHPIYTSLDYNGCRIEPRIDMIFKSNLIYLFGVEGSKNIRLSWIRIPPKNIASVPIIIDIVTLNNHGTNQLLRGFASTTLTNMYVYTQNAFKEYPTNAQTLLNLMGVIEGMVKGSRGGTTGAAVRQTTPATADKIKLEPVGEEDE